MPGKRLFLYGGFITRHLPWLDSIAWPGAIAQKQKSSGYLWQPELIAKKFNPLSFPEP
jgi:hypothetical protein